MTYLETSLSPYQENLEAQVNNLGYQLEYFLETPTTMDVIDEYLMKGRTSPLVALTEHQNRGIGRDNRVWHDQAGCSVMFSTNKKIRPDLVAILADLAALKTCLAVQGVTGIELKLKYPNDFVVDGEKTGGILVRNCYQARIYRGTNIGIGKNVHYLKSDLEGYSQDPNYPVTALDLHTEKPNSRQDILIAILQGLRYIDSSAQIFSTNNQRRQDLNQVWQSQSCVLGRTVAISIPERDLIRGKVVSTEIGKGIQIEIAGGLSIRWFNQFDTKMKVRLLD